MSGRRNTPTFLPSTESGAEEEDQDEEAQLGLIETSNCSDEDEDGRWIEHTSQSETWISQCGGVKHGRHW